MRAVAALAVLLAQWASAHASLIRANRIHKARRTHASSGSSLRAQLGFAVQDMLLRKSTTSRHIAHKVHQKMTLKDALPLLENQLPHDVTALLRTSQQGGTKREFSEVSLAKGRVYLNTMMYDAWLQLDQIEVECKEFEESNRMVFSQVTTDLEHLGSDLADQQRMKVEAEGCISDAETNILTLKSNLDSMKRSYQATRIKNSYELSLRQDDQDVFTAILQLSKCPNEFGDDSYSLAQFSICQTVNGTEVVTSDSALAAKVKNSTRVQKALQSVLDAGSAPGAGAPSLLQLSQAPLPEPVEETKGSSRKCVNGKVNCGYLHDLMALEWGKFKDLVDELTYTMMQNRDQYESEKENLNEQIATLRSQKMKCMEWLGESISEINSLTATTREKQEQYRDIEHAYDIKMADCKKRMEEILYTNICGTKTVRNSLMRYSTVSPTESIADCEVTDWSAGPCTADGRGSSVPVDCDDTCPSDVGGVNVDSCGGMKHLTRQVIISPNSFGMKCPPLFYERKNGSAGMKCNQFHCPINCLLSEWTDWSTCSKECGGGTQDKTRSILRKPKNGGTECDTTLEAQPCHTGSCDRDCTLMPWTDWEPCSMACGGGEQQRFRKVDIPIRANGKCPGETHADRLQMQQCNTQDCVGDEICIAHQDLVIALDGSGSLKQEGFDQLKKFALNLTSKYQSVYYGVEDMRIGVVLFGNGEYYDNGTVAAAKEVLPITGDLESVATAIADLEWQRGFTNMMQALTAADNMFSEGREDTQSAVMVISDGKWTNAYRTGMKATAMKEKGIQIFMAPIAEHENDNLKILRGWASSPWETNYERIPGFEALLNNEKEFAQRLLVKFCPLAFSPSLKREQEESVGYLKIHEQGFPADECGAWKYIGQRDTSDACMESVREQGILAFSYEDAGRWAGTCYSEAIEVAEDLWNLALDDRVNLTCPGEGGAWIFNRYASTYIMNPSMFGNIFEDVE